MLNGLCENYGLLMIRNATHISICDRHKYPPMLTHLAHIQFDALISMSEKLMEEEVVRSCLDSMALTGRPGTESFAFLSATPNPGGTYHVVESACKTTASP